MVGEEGENLGLGMSPGGIMPGKKGCWANRQIFEESSAAISVH
jgi:hypothetical protein